VLAVGRFCYQKKFVLAVGKGRLGGGFRLGVDQAQEKQMVEWAAMADSGEYPRSHGRFLLDP
jgi:hypothetical protein